MSTTPTTAIPSKFDGRCKTCGVTWAIGDTIFRHPKFDRPSWCRILECAEGDAPKPQTVIGDSWPVAVLALTPAEHRPYLFRTLVALLHPDAGGDPELLIDLIEARNRLSGGTCD